MKNAYLLFALFLSGLAFAQTPLDTKNPQATVTVDYFFEACTVVGETEFGMIPHFDCETYIYGVLDTYRALKNSVKNSAACLPANLEPWRVYQIFSVYPLKNQGNKVAAPLMIEALTQKYPCGK